MGRGRAVVQELADDGGQLRRNLVVQDARFRCELDLVDVEFDFWKTDEEPARGVRHVLGSAAEGRTVSGGKTQVGPENVPAQCRGRNNRLDGGMDQRQ